LIDSLKYKTYFGLPNGIEIGGGAVKNKFKVIVNQWLKYLNL